MLLFFYFRHQCLPIELNASQWKVRCILTEEKKKKDYLIKPPPKHRSCCQNGKKYLLLNLSEIHKKLHHILWNVSFPLFRFECFLSKPPNIRNQLRIGFSSLWVVLSFCLFDKKKKNFDVDRGSVLSSSVGFYIFHHHL